MNGPNWLTVFNYALILIVVSAWLGLLISVGWELAERRAQKARESSVDQGRSLTLVAELHRIPVPELGLTMADGGEAVKAADAAPEDKKPVDQKKETE